MESWAKKAANQTDYKLEPNRPLFSFRARIALIQKNTQPVSLIQQGNPEPMSFSRRLYLSFIRKFRRFMSIESYLTAQYEYKNKKPIDIRNPVEFNQKIQWLKAFYHPPILHKLVDKYAVREYVAEKAGKQYLNEFIALYDKRSEIDFTALPNQFVMKVVHGCGYNIIVPDKSKLNVCKAKLKLFKWTNKDQYQRTHKEWAYKGVKPRIMVEAFMQEEGKSCLSDYKFYCFNGKPKFVEYHLDRHENHLSAFYDLDFQPLEFRDVSEDELITQKVDKPARFEEMIEVAEKLADRLPFVRVDLYHVNEKIIFGEMTFYPGSGSADFHPEKYNKILGDMLELPKIPEDQKEITDY